MTFTTTPSSPTPGAHEGQRVVIIGPVLPHDGMSHAGGVYLQHLHQALHKMGADITFLVEDSDLNRTGADQPGSPSCTVFVGLTQRHTLVERAIMRTVSVAHGRLAQRDPTWPLLPVLAQLVISREARRAIRSADVIDLQWPEYARALPLVRSLNRRARVIVTLHDVLSQRWQRRAASDPPEHWERSLRAAESARRLENSTARSSATIIVFSEKDRALLPRGAGASIEVLAPPLAAAPILPRCPDGDNPRVVFVSLLNRSENDDAARWLVNAIWPSVIRRTPQARLRLVGQGASEELRAACAATRGVQLTGFVPDLAAEYARAAASVVPLRRGAGVKFKTVEALVAGVPTVTTRVGAEGIAGPERFAAVAEDPSAIADALVSVLQDPPAAEAFASGVQNWALDRYSLVHFERDVRRIYGLEG